MTVRSTTRPRVRPASPLKTVGTPPKDALKDVYRWADYVELRCLVSLDLELTMGDLVAALRLDPEESPYSEDVEGDVSQEADSDTGESPSYAGSEDSESTEGSAAMSVDNRHRLSGEVFDLLETRFLMYEDAYPFLIEPHRVVRVESLSSLQRTYIFLLLCSLGRYVEQHGLLAKSFERLCAAVLEFAIPGAEIHIFGTAQDNGSKFSGNFLTRATALAEFLGENLQPGATEISRSENGDRGLDVVASLETGDGLPSRLVVFGQAATGRNWHEKQHSVTNLAWDSIIQVTAPAVAACLIPICFRDIAGTWHDSTLIHRSWVLDRCRIIHQARKRRDESLMAGWEDEQSVSVVDGVLGYRFTE